MEDHLIPAPKLLTQVHPFPSTSNDKFSQRHEAGGAAGIRNPCLEVIEDGID